MVTGVVIPVGPDRDENLQMALKHLLDMSFRPKAIVMVMDGPAAWWDNTLERTFPVITAAINAPKHAPGLEQPRNLGVRMLEKIGREHDIEFTHAWFLDSDCIVHPSALAHYEKANVAAGPELRDKRVMIGPYDWLPPDLRRIAEDYRCDPEGVPPPGRWQSFDAYGPEETRTNDLSSGLACFSGNLVWPIEEFKRVGGFWNEIHHGRCEDGELGLRAVAMGVPIAFVRDARAWHLNHPRNAEWIINANRRDVPMLNDRHPWVQRCVCGHDKDGHAGAEHEGGCTVCGECNEFRPVLFVVEEDGKRFNARCGCGWEGNTALIWNHQSECSQRTEVEVKT